MSGAVDMTNSKTQQESMLIPTKDLLVGSTILFIPSNKTLLFKVLPHKFLSFDVVSWIFLYQPHGCGTPPSPLRALRLASTRGQNVHPTCHRHGNPGSRGCPVRYFVGNLTVPPPQQKKTPQEISPYEWIIIHHCSLTRPYSRVALRYLEIPIMCGFLWQDSFSIFPSQSSRWGERATIFVGRMDFFCMLPGGRKKAGDFSLKENWKSTSNMIIIP